MIGSRSIQLTTLWFVVLIFIQTGTDTANSLISVIGILALFLAYILPLIIVGLLVSWAVGD